MSNPISYLVKTEIGVQMGFGKHIHEHIEDVPKDYLTWCLREIQDAPPEFHEAIRAELHRREHAGCLAFDFEGAV
jgi:hypothetical protein